MKDNSKTIIAIDFDDTLFKTINYPNELKPKWRVINKVKKLINKGYCCCLWTCRSGDNLKIAVELCKSVGIGFEWVNENPDFAIKQFGNDCRKIGATYYIDDKNLNIIGFLIKRF